MQPQVQELQDLQMQHQKEAGEGSPVVTYEQPELEAKYAQYEEKESFEDYAEMVVQYGFVTLFVVKYAEFGQPQN